MSAIAKEATLYETIVSRMRQSTSADDLHRIVELIEATPYTSIMALTQNVVCARYAEMSLLLADQVTKS